MDDPFVHDSHMQVPLRDPTQHWQAAFTGMQLGVFEEYELTNGKRTGFGVVRIGSQRIRARLPWLSDGKSAILDMPLERSPGRFPGTVVVLGFLQGQTRTYGEAVIVGMVARDLVKDANGEPVTDIDDIFRDAKPGEKVIRSRWSSNDTLGTDADRTTLLYMKADGSVVITVDEQAGTPLKVTLGADRKIIIENADTIRATSDHVTINSPDINLGGNTGSPVIRNIDFPVHVDPMTGAPIQAFQYPTSSTKTKSE